MHLVLTGATGLIGSAVLHQMLTTPSVTRISILSRRPVPQAEGHAKANVIIHKDFAHYSSEVLSSLKDVDGVVWAQGISVTQVSKAEYKDITITYPLAFAQSLAKTTSPKPLNFIYISGHGATTTPGRLTSHFALIKGQCETALLALPLQSNNECKNLNPYSLRPAMIDAREHQEIHKWLAPRKGFEKYLPWMFPVVGWMAPQLMSPTRDLARVCVGMAMGEMGGGVGSTGVEAVGGDVSDGGRILSCAAVARLASAGGDIGAGRI